MFDPVLMTVGAKLVELCKAGKEVEALDTLYSEDVVSVEAADMGEAGREVAGLEGLRAKHDWWFGAHEVEKMEAEGPFFFGDSQFAIVFDMAAKVKETGERMDGKEVGIYSVRDGKITREEFFYGV